MSVLQYAPRGEFSRLERLGFSAVEQDRRFERFGPTVVQEWSDGRDSP